ncbi:hypothetical protein CHS0354_032543 [Potamilus streckersoni]|uniref:GPR180/TMEM145 transmembrane domain-containing protein n=1 Tax=Potamilus streckersoni TaxID=2493646 RepID=A0AAE0SQW4_9BIVA|nr:hypothetical protein CHS0354_032543 [Potamilus streckersoni]
MKELHLIWTLYSICDVSLRAGALHLKGTWRSNEFYLFLAKFGFQKTDPKYLEDTQGFIYGNITSKSSTQTYITLAVVDSEYFMELYGNSTLSPEKACPFMFNKIDTIAFNPYCKAGGLEDFLRNVPCPTNKLCVDEDNPSNVIPSYQFTYRIQDSIHPRFWYISLASCYRNATKRDCHWYDSTSEAIEIEYDIWLVNGIPSSKHLNPFEHQFSFELHDVFEIYAIFVLFYIFMILLWIYAYRRQIHNITRIFTSCIILEFTGNLLNLIHVLIFAINGAGVPVFQIFGNAIDLIAQCLFMLLLLLIAKGWTILQMELDSKYKLFCIWGLYTAFNCGFFIWNLRAIDIISNVDEWNSYPGYLILGFRLVIMVWFIIQLRLTFSNCKQPQRLDFFQQFGAYYLVWFIYMPILAVIATQLSFLWRYKTILSITNAADYLSYLVLIHLLWPSRSVLYLIKQEPSITYDMEVAGLLDDLEETQFSQELQKKNGQIAMELHNTLHPKLVSGSPVTNGYRNKSLQEVEEEEAML